jgi:hypothetical protein
MTRRTGQTQAGARGVGRPLNGGRMTEAWLYAGVTAAMAAVMTAAVWRPRPGQWVLLLVGPLLAAGGAAASVSSGSGLAVLLVIPYTYLLLGCP